MAVYERSWRRYDGPLTPLAWRFTVITRHSLQRVFASRQFVFLYILAALPAVVNVLIIFFSYNLSALDLFNVAPTAAGRFAQASLQQLFGLQVFPAFLLTVIIAPGLVAPDLADNGLSLYLSRPIRRVDYVLGKMAVLAVVLSPVTWIASLLVAGFYLGIAGPEVWGVASRIAVAQVAGHLSWILVVSLVSLAVSAWVRLRALASGVLLGVLFLPRAVAQSLNAALGTRWGFLLDPFDAIRSIVLRLSGESAGVHLPAWASVATLLAVCLVSLLLLARKLEPHEVVK